MRLRSLVLLWLCLVLGLFQADLAAAVGFGLFQHGGRAMGQAGAFTARASEPSALTYNPAAITRLDGFQAQAGLDLSNAETKYSNPDAEYSAKHIIDFPPAIYLTWKGQGPFAFGIGVDSPFWYKLDWEPALFPGRFEQRRFELAVWEVHPVIAYDLGEGWSVGGGLRYLFGTLEQEDNRPILVTHNNVLYRGEVERTAKADVDVLAWDAAIHYTAPAWGWGAVYRSTAQLKGNGDVSYDPRDIPDNLVGPVREGLGGGSTRQSFEIPRELRTGIWYAPYPELRLEMDLAWQSWSSLEATSITITPAHFGEPETREIRRDWDDTFSVRLGAEGNITDNFLLFGGFAWEPSPVPDSTVRPDLPRGDAMVYAAGFSYNFPQISFDVGYSFHDHDRRNARENDASYTARAQVWGFSVRWRR